jgi:hypothetical protein
MGRLERIVESFPAPRGTFPGIEALPDPAILIVGVAPVISSVQTGSVTLEDFPLTPSLEASFSLSPTIDPTRTLLSSVGYGGFGVVIESGGDNTDETMCTCVIDGGGTDVTFLRHDDDGRLVAHATVMEFSSGVKTQPVSIDIALADTSDVATITAVDVNKTIIVPNGVNVEFNFQDFEDFSVWWVLTNSTTVTASRNTGVSAESSGSPITATATVLEFL